MPKARIWEGVGHRSTPVTVSGRVLIAGVAIVRADIDSIACKVLRHDTGALVTAPTIVVSDVVFDTLQTGGEWDTDSAGYNFLHQLPAAAFPAPGRYTAYYTFTKTDDATFPLQMRITILSDDGAIAAA